MSNTWLIVGLGNAGPDYSATRHNVGHMVADVLAKRIGANFKTHKAGAVVAEGRLGEDKIVIAKSTGYMNTSGRPVAALEKFYSVANSNLIAIHDELDIPSMDVRIKFGGGTLPPTGWT